MLKTGMIIAERYEIVSKIGSGGMADVYKTKDHKLNRYVAVKVLKPEYREDKTFIRKFQSEAQAAAGLTHPNIVNVFDVGDDNGVYYIVMELIEGITLKEYISKKGKLSVKEATSIAIQVSMGLEAAHNHGIVHRDVKPQNIIISTDGKVKVADFGIARAASFNTISSNVMGSVHYSSPEQVRGGYSDEKSDIYSLGITLYEMVAGKVPFDGDTTVAIAIKHLQEEMVPPSAYAPELPYSLEQIILKCTQKSVDRRYGRMEEVIADLKHSLIDPQGDFVKLVPLDTDAKTVVITDKELGQIKHKKETKAVKPSGIKDVDVEALEEEEYEENYGYDDGDDEEEEPKREIRRKKDKAESKKPVKVQNHMWTILTLLAGAVILIILIFVIAKATGLLGGGKDSGKDAAITEAGGGEDDAMVEVPNLVGMTEDQASEATRELGIGLQSMGEEASDQEKGRISSQDIAAGTKVEKYSTIKYYISKGTQEITVPDVTDRTGYEAEQILKDTGFNVTVTKEYSELDTTGYPLTEPGYVLSTNPASGASAKAGDSITLVVSRGADLGDSVEVPSVVGTALKDAVTTLGKFSDIDIQYEQSSEVAEGEVLSQSPEAYSYASPDSTVILTVCGTAPEETQTAGETASDTSQGTTAGADGTWKCTQQLDTPTGYQGGNIRLELVQTVDGEPVATTVAQGQKLTFPYQLDLIGASGVSEGTLYLSEEIDGEYTELGHYPIKFEKVQ